jgi:hypothetical protein
MRESVDPSIHSCYAKKIFEGINQSGVLPKEFDAHVDENEECKITPKYVSQAKAGTSTYVIYECIYFIYQLQTQRHSKQPKESCETH